MDREYTIFLSDEAKRDIDKLGDVIIYDYQAPVTAFRYVQGLLNAIKSITKAPEIFTIQTHQSLQQYGQNVRRVNYKKMAIIYTIHGHIVYVHRIIPSTMIFSLPFTVNS